MKATWTDADFGAMGWHDCRVHALSIGLHEDGFPWHRVLLDLDYIVRWVGPEIRGEIITFWIAPATLVFEEAWDVTGDLAPSHDLLDLDGIRRLDPPDERPDPLWHLAGHNFDLRLRAPGFTQYLRTPPVHSSQQYLPLSSRGGLSFAEQPLS